MLSYRLGTVNDFHWEFKPVEVTVVRKSNIPGSGVC